MMTTLALPQVTILLPRDLSAIARQHSALCAAEQEAGLPWDSDGDGRRPAGVADHATTIRAVDAFVEQHRAEIDLIRRLAGALPEGGVLVGTDEGAVLARGQVPLCGHGHGEVTTVRLSGPDLA